MSVFTVFSCKLNRQNKSQKDQPNILLLLADDLGYGELGCYGQKMIKTPVLDSLAKKSMRFTDFYAGNAVCSPSRAVLMTGISSSYNTIRGNTGYFGDDNWMRVALKMDEITIAEMLQEAGYQTGFVGKWHLDDPIDLSTWAYSRGFDYAIQEQWGARKDGGTFDEQMHWINGMQDSIYYDVNEWECKDDFRTKLAFDYLDNINKNKPFFLCMSYRAPHGHEKSIGNNSLYQDTDWPAEERLHASKITLLDKQIGRMLTKLKTMGVLDNTLVIFTSDNGPHGERHNPHFFESSGGLNGIKRELYEGGVRVPMIVYWKDKIVAGSISNHVSGFHDLMPTFAEVAGVDPPEASNGLSILPELIGGKPQQHEYLNWEFQMFGGNHRIPDLGFRQSARVGNWKIVRYGIDSDTELYNLETDIKEKKNLAKQYPEIVAEMEKLFKNRAYSDNYPEGGAIRTKVITP